MLFRLIFGVTTFMVVFIWEKAKTIRGSHIVVAALFFSIGVLHTSDQLSVDGVKERWHRVEEAAAVFIKLINSEEEIPIAPVDQDYEDSEDYNYPKNEGFYTSK